MKVVVVGGGIIGLAHAYQAAKAGHEVTLLERDSKAEGSSVRNFGMVWPIGQPLGERRALALRSRDLWIQVAQELQIPVRECGSYHLAHHPSEMSAIEQFCTSAGPEVAEIHGPGEVLRRSPDLRADDLLGGMWSPYELSVDPRITCALYAEGLRSRLEVQIRFNTTVHRVTENQVHHSQGVEEADHVFVCSGHVLHHLYSDLLAERGIQLCKLEMLRGRWNAPVPNPGPHLCAGLTLLHYESFTSLPALAEVRAHWQETAPDALEAGVHILVAQHPDGTITIGDSHEYGSSFDITSSQRIQSVIERELDRFLPAERWTIYERWTGQYAKCATEPYVVIPLGQSITLVNGVGGHGMTISQGLAEQVLKERLPQPAGV